MKTARLPKRIWLTANNLDADYQPGECDTFAHVSAKSAREEAERMTHDGYPSHVVGPYVLASNGGRRDRR